MSSNSDTLSSLFINTRNINIRLSPPMIRRQPKFNRSIIHIDLIDDVKTHILSIYSDISDNLIDLHQSISLPLSTEN